MAVKVKGNKVRQVGDQRIQLPGLVYASNGNVNSKGIETKIHEAVTNNSGSSNITETMSDILCDLSSRFLINLPNSELTSIPRICFQIEQAHWYYEDFLREDDPKLPSFRLREFSAMLFKTCPMLQHWTNEHERAFEDFIRYKTRVPVCGAALFNPQLDQCVLVKGWKASSTWGFPKGKIDQGETKEHCAIREVLEETGFDISHLILPDSYMDLAIQDQNMRIYFVPNVPMDTVFQTRTRKEISKISWFKLADLPTWKKSKQSDDAANTGKYYLISPFVSKMKSFIYERKKGIKYAKESPMAERDQEIRPSTVLFNETNIPTILSNSNPNTQSTNCQDEYFSDSQADRQTARAILQSLNIFSPSISSSQPSSLHTNSHATPNIPNQQTALLKSLPSVDNPGFAFSDIYGIST